MNKAKTGSILLILMIVFIINSVFAEGIISLDKAEWYRKGQIEMELEQYAEAVEAFTQAGNYEESKTLATYCRGMMLLQEANGFETKGFKTEMDDCLDKAENYFKLLSGIEYGESKKLLQYVQARKFESNRLTQKAIDLYAELFGICDSDERYLRLKDGNLITPVTTPAVSNQVLTLINAQVNQETKTYNGPGSSYPQNSIVITPEMPVSIVGQSGEWYLAETVYDEYKVRLWVPKIRMMRQESAEPALLDGNAAGKVSYTTVIYYGPGSEYMTMESVIEANTPVTVIAEDGIYAMIEFIDKADQEPIRGWVLRSVVK